jgi:1-acyl-sn-glycerol-3-phosphate acyltransferase
MRISRRALPHVAPDRPIVICCNHPSWWDPIVFILLMHILFPNQIGFGPMDAVALKRYGVLRKMGVFGIDLETRDGAVQFLTVGARILAQPHSVLWITAEGALTDTRVRPVRLKSGVAHLARRVPHAVILPLALEYSFWNERRPEALVHFGQPVDANDGRNVRDWTIALEAELTQTIDELAAMSVKRDPELFTQLLRGRTGIGGVYDLWRYSTATIAGRRFNPAHEPDG